MSKVAHIWSNIQAVLFPHLERCLDTKLTEQRRQLVAILEIVRIEDHVPPGWVQVLGCPKKDRRALARAFVAKAVYDFPTSKLLVEMLKTQPNLLSICGWKHADEVPSESTFSRAFDEFATSKLADKVHAALVEEHVSERLVGHVSRDSTAMGRTASWAEGAALSIQDSPGQRYRRPAGARHQSQTPQGLPGTRQ